MKQRATLKVVALGGGTGLPVVLKGLRRAARRCEIQGHFVVHSAAVVTVADDGGSSGLLRRAFGTPAVGDLRNCLAALSEAHPLLIHLFQHRFAMGEELKGHALGNLMLTALFQKSGSLREAVGLAGQLLRCKGYVMPATETPVTLCAEFEDGAVIRGEAQIPTALKKISRVWLDPPGPPASPGVLRNIASADVIVLGPGSLYTSVIPNLLVEGVAKTIRNSPALRLFICNLMTQPGETDGFSASHHLQVLESYLGGKSIDICLINSGSMSPCVAERYLASGSELVECDQEEIARRGVVPVVADLVPEQEEFQGKHDPSKLGRMILFLASGARGTGELAGTRQSFVA